MPDADPAAPSVASVADRRQTLDYAGRTDVDPRRALRWIALIVFVAVVGRVGYAFTRPDTASTLASLPDQLEYLAAGQSILDGSGVSFVDPTFSQTLFAFRMPGYPIFVAACGADVRVIRAAQAVLDGSSVLAMFLIARRLRGDTAGLVAAAAVGGNPYLIYFSTLILSETLFTTCLAWGTWLLLCPRRRQRVAGVLVLLSSVYVRPSAIGLGVVAAGVAFASSRPRRRLAATMLAGVAVCALLLPWALRNHAMFGRLVWTTTNGGYTAYDSFNPSADGSSNQSSFRPRFDAAGPDGAGVGREPARGAPLFEFNRQRRLGELGRHEEYTRLAWAYARSHPRRVAQLALAKLGRFWSPVPLSADFGGRSTYVIVGGLYAVPLFALAVIGVWRGSLRRHATLTLLLPAIYFSLVHCVFVGSLRYRVPCDAPLAVVAAAGAMSLVRPRVSIRAEETM